MHRGVYGDLENSAKRILCIFEYIAHIFIRGVDASQAILLRKALFQRQAESNVEICIFNIS